MPVDPDKKDGRVRPDRIEIFLARAGRRKGVIAPAEAADDVHLADLVAIGLERVENFLAGVELKIDASRDGGADERVDVALYKAGQQHLPGEIHDAGLRPYEFLNARLVADVDDALCL